VFERLDPYNSFSVAAGGVVHATAAIAAPEVEDLQSGQSLGGQSTVKMLKEP
jgi:hypothetical protein